MALTQAEKAQIAKREAFKKYIDEKKVNDILVGIIVAAYERQKWPADALVFIQDCLAPDTGGADILTIREENADLTEQLVRLKVELAALGGPPV